MAPHLVRFKLGDEFKAMTKRGRRCHGFRAGTRAAYQARLPPPGKACFQGVRGLMVPLDLRPAGRLACLPNSYRLGL